MSKIIFFNKQTFESMKKIFKYAMMSAIAFTGAVSFSACQSSDEIVDNPNYNAKEGTVKTQFAIGITSQANAITRMAEATTQAETPPRFRGMDYFILIPFDKTPAVGVDRLGSYITAGNNKINGTDVTGSSSGVTGTANYAVFNDVTVPTGTSHFLFYGRAPRGTDVSTNFSLGYLTPSVAVEASGSFDTPASLTFTPTSIRSKEYDDDIAGGSTVGQNLIDLLTKVATVSATVSGSTKAWSAVTAEENALLYQAYQNFTKLESGSSFNVQRTIKDLYILVNDLAQLNDNPYQPLAAAIQTAITTGVNSSAIKASGTTLDFTNDGAHTAYDGYPGDLNLPEGATHIAFASNAFTDQMKTSGSTDQAGATTTNDKKTKYSTYAYPADLWYWKSTALRASNEIESTNFTAGQGWNTEATDIINTWYGNGKAFDVVSGSSKSVALVEPIDYAVARLDLDIAALPSGITDSRMNVMDFGKTYSANPTADTEARNGFKNAIKLTGVLVGYQQQVNWQFIPVTGTEYVIYDNKIPTAVTALSTDPTGTGKNYTLVLQTPKDQTVNIALQFKNDGPDFYGKNGQLIPSGGTFYLSGGLDPKASTGVTGYVDGSKDKVFIQDHVTSVTLTIKAGGNKDDGSNSGTANDGIVDNPEGFQEATNTIPDLRTPQLELCFSVDLTWQTGLTFSPQW